MDRNINETDNFINENSELIEKIEEAFKIYKLSELFLKDVSDDYGKLKIARLRLDFARHELLTLMEEAKCKGVELKNSAIIEKFLHPDS